MSEQGGYEPITPQPVTDRPSVKELLAGLDSSTRNEVYAEWGTIGKPMILASIAREFPTDAQPNLEDYQAGARQALNLTGFLVLKLYNRFRKE